MVNWPDCVPVLMNWTIVMRWMTMNRHWNCISCYGCEHQLCETRLVFCEKWKFLKLISVSTSKLSTIEHTPTSKMDPNQIERVVCESFPNVGSPTVRYRRLCKMGCHIECVILETIRHCRVTVHLVFVEDSAWPGHWRWLWRNCQKPTQNWVCKREVFGWILHEKQLNCSTYIWWLVQWSVSGGIESNESGVALRDRVPVLDASTSRNTSRMSGFLGCRDLVRPRTVRFNALTRCLTASACDRGKPTRLDVNSPLDSSRPCKMENLYEKSSIEILIDAVFDDLSQLA